MQPSPDRGLLYLELCRELCLVESMLTHPSFQALHGPSIVDTYTSATGLTYKESRHTSRVSKTTRTFWARTKEALEEARLPATQVYVAKRLGVRQPSVSEWNVLGGFPTLENAISLARLLNVNVEWLLTERGPKRPLPQDATAQRLWDIWTQLDDVTKGELVGIASGRLRRSDDATPEEHPRAKAFP